MGEGLTSRVIKAIDAYTINTIGIPSMVLMERAALAIVEELLNGDTQAFSSYAIVCGTGNNGGDGLAVGRLLHQAGKQVTLYLVGNSEKGTPDFQKQLSIARNLAIPIESFDSSVESFRGDGVIDALFGIGLDREVKEPHKTAITCLNQSKGKIIAVDVPSGLSADTGKTLGTAVKADMTYTIGFMKQGFSKSGAKEYLGDYHVLPIGYPAPELLVDVIKKEQTNEKSF